MSGHKSKKRRSEHINDETFNGHTMKVDTSKPTAVFKPRKGRQHTLSIAFPGSILANVHTPAQKTALVGHIGRACAVFCVDEVIIFDDGQVEKLPPERDGYAAYTDQSFFFFHVLSYLETPPHLRKALFPLHPNLKGAGALPSLDMPHHMKADEWCQYREGVTVSSTGFTGTMVDCGLTETVTVSERIEPDTRVTLKLATTPSTDETEEIQAEVVAPETPREEAGYYWGYNVRQASSLSAVLTECSFDGGYDMSVGTSERGTHLKDIVTDTGANHVPPTWNHLLIVFGGVAGLEVALKADKDLQSAGVSEVKDLFDRWVNLVPAQGSRTIRTEEAVWLGLMGLRPLVEARDGAAWGTSEPYAYM